MIAGTIGKWGNSLALRLPKEVVGHLNLKEGETIAFVTNKDGQITIIRKPPVYTQEQLLAGITDENMHPFLEW